MCDPGGRLSGIDTGLDLTTIVTDAASVRRSLPETVAQVGVAVRRLPRRERRRLDGLVVARQVARTWTAVSDPGTTTDRARGDDAGFAPNAYLRARLVELARASAATEPRRALMVVQVLDPAYDTLPSVIVARLGELVASGETVAEHGPGCAVALVERDGRLRDLLGRLRSEPAVADVRVWLEPLPAEHNLLDPLLAELRVAPAPSPVSVGLWRRPLRARRVVAEVTACLPADGHVVAATVALVETLGTGRPSMRALRRHAEACAQAGLTLEETLGDLERILRTVAPDAGRGPASLDRALPAIEVFASAPDVSNAPWMWDPLSGLPTEEYGRRRLDERRRALVARRHAPDDALVGLLVVPGPPPRPRSPFGDIGRRVRIGHTSRAALPDADPVMTLTDGSVVAVVARGLVATARDRVASLAGTHWSVTPVPFSEL